MEITISDIIKTKFSMSAEFLNTSNKALESLHHLKKIHTKESAFIFPSYQQECMHIFAF